MREILTINPLQEKIVNAQDINLIINYRREQRMHEILT